MTSKLISITCTGPNQYELQLEALDTHRRSVFTFDVEPGDIEVVRWSPEFAAYMQQNLGPASPLLDLVLKFHGARKVGLP
jgi:hypothetical protein